MTMTAPAAPRSRVSALRVIVADDQLPFRVALRRLLKRAGDIDIIAEAADGAEAVALVERLSPDLVLLDVRMPGMDGPTAARIIAERFPDVAIVLCSSHGPEDIPTNLAAPFVPKESLTADVVRAAAHR